MASCVIQHFPSHPLLPTNLQKIYDSMILCHVYAGNNDIGAPLPINLSIQYLLQQSKLSNWKVIRDATKVNNSLENTLRFLSHGSFLQTNLISFEKHLTQFHAQDTHRTLKSLSLPEIISTLVFTQSLCSTLGGTSPSLDCPQKIRGMVTSYYFWIRTWCKLQSMLQRQS